MDDLRNLIFRFKELNGAKAANFKNLEPYIKDDFLKLRLSLAFDTMVSCLTQVHNMLSNASVYGSSAKDLFDTIDEVDMKLFSGMDQQSLDIESFLALIGSIPVKCNELYKEILNPSCKMMV